MDEQVKEFFQKYETANASSNVSAIAELYAGTFTFDHQHLATVLQS